MGETNWLKMDDAMGKKRDKINSLSVIKGSWLDHLIFDDKRYWNIEMNKKIAKQQQFDKDPLPSEGRFREDYIWLSYGNEEYA